MDCQSKKERIVQALRRALIYDPRPGVSVPRLAQQMKMKMDTLRSKLRNDLPATLSFEESLSMLECTRDVRLFNEVLPDGFILLDMGRIEAAAPEDSGLALAGVIAGESGDVVRTLAEVMEDGRVEEQEAGRFARECIEGAAVCLGAAEYVSGKAIHQPRLALAMGGGR